MLRHARVWLDPLLPNVGFEIRPTQEQSLQRAMSKQNFADTLSDANYSSRTDYLS
jgi:hypothetical protein